MTAGGDVFSNLNLTQSNSASEELNSHPRGPTAAGRESVVAAGVSEANAPVLSLIFNSCPTLPKCSKLFILSGNLTNISDPETSFRPTVGFGPTLLHQSLKPLLKDSDWKELLLDS